MSESRPTVLCAFDGYEHLDPDDRPYQCRYPYGQQVQMISHGQYVAWAFRREQCFRDLYRANRGKPGRVDELFRELDELPADR